MPARDRDAGTAPNAATDLAALAGLGAFGALAPGGEVGNGGDGGAWLQVVPLVVPEPATLALLGSGLAGLVVAGRRRV